MIDNLNWRKAPKVKILSKNIMISAIIEDANDVLIYNADKYIITRYKIETGDLIEYNGIIYIIVSQVDRNIESEDERKNNYRARMIQADYSIKFIIDEELKEVPAIIEGKIFDIVDEKIISLPDDKIIVTIKDDIGIEKEMRFIKLEQVWKIIGIDRTKKGLLICYCDVDAISHLDDMVNEIANRWIDVSGEKIDRLPWLDNQEPPEQPTEPQDPDEPIEEPEPEPKNIIYEIEIIPQYASDDGTEIYYGEWCKYAVHKFADGQEVNGNLTFEIEILNNPQNIELATLEVENNICKVIANNNAIMGGSIKLVTTDTETKQVAIEKEIEIMGM